MEKVAVSLLISVVSPVITKLGNLTKSFFGGDVTKAEIDKLKHVSIPLISTVIREAENIKSESLEPWLIDLREIAYEIEDLLDMYEYKKMGDEISSLPSSMKKMKNKTKEFLSFIMLKKALRTSLEKIQQSADDASKTLIPLLQLVSKNSTMQHGYAINQQSTTVSGMSSTVFGRDEERDYLINLLIHEPNEPTSSNASSRKRILVYSLHGIGGTGKTTLAQYIYNDENIKSHFDERIWVEVTHVFSAEKIIREIIHGLKRNEPPPSGETFDMLQNTLKQVLPAKKILLVLDNVWCEKKGLWDQLLIPFNEVGEYGCRILITARYEEVGLALNVNINMPLKELENDDCWSILMDHATHGSEKIITDPELIAIGNKIVMKLKKSPLALRMVGSLLGKKTNVVEWEQILNQDMPKEITDVLFFSFQNLPIHLQRCFTYCSLYPKGWRFSEQCVKCLVRQWIAAGFVEPLKESKLTFEELGMQYFNALVSYSFFQKDNDFRTLYKIHDLLHDLAEMFSKGSFFRIESEEQLCISTTIRHLSVTTYIGGTVGIHDILNLVNLRTLLILSVSDTDCKIIIEEFDEICKKLTKLRVLCVPSWCAMQSLNSFGKSNNWLNSIGKLRLLRYLDLYKVKNLPKSFGKLYHLQYLILDRGHYLTIPKSFCNLIKLRRFTCFEQKKSKIVNIANITLLEQLNYFYPQNGDKYGMKQLRNLQQLRGSLAIHNLENVSDEVEAMEAKINCKSYLRKLKLKWDEEGTNKLLTNTSEDVLKGIRPHSNLKDLCIKYYMGSKAPEWMVYFPDHLPNLRFLQLTSCQNLTDLHYLPPNLQHLILQDCSKLELHHLPPHLQTLALMDCPKLEDKLCLLTGLNSLSILYLRGFPHIQILSDLSPFLKSLEIYNCPELISMGNINLHTSLTRLIVRGCPKLTAHERTATAHCLINRLFRSVGDA